MKDSMNILVTGGTGFIGSHLCEKLVRKDHSVFALSHTNDVSNVQQIVNNDNFSILEGDITNFGEIKEVVEKVAPDIIFHMASFQPASQKPKSFFQVNIKGTFNLLLSIGNNANIDLITSSSKMVYGAPEYLPVDEKHVKEPLDHYGTSKLCADNYVKLFARENGIKSVVLRYPGVYGPRAEATFLKYLLSRFLQNSNVEITSPGYIKDYVYVKDVVNANLASMDLLESDHVNFEIINVGSGHKLTKYEMAQKAREVCDVNTEVHRGEETADDFDFYFDLKKARRLLNYGPRPFEEAVGDYWNWLQRRQK